MYIEMGLVAPLVSAMRTQWIIEFDAAKKDSSKS